VDSGFAAVVEARQHPIAPVDFGLVEPLGYAVSGVGGPAVPVGAGRMAVSVRLP
jgi:hypothetical protein